ncbi:hypothetical protein INR49_030597 [Caranx melampygus]|nr:hypothetical protein INR49_030597 [Caranx melampygus]
MGWSLLRGRGKEDREGERRREDRRREETEEEEEEEEEEKVSESRTLSTYMGCVLSSDWCGEEEVQPVPVVRNPSLKRRSLERSESGRMRLTKSVDHVGSFCRVCKTATHRKCEAKVRINFSQSLVIIVFTTKSTDGFHVCFQPPKDVFYVHFSLLMKKQNRYSWTVHLM